MRGTVGVLANCLFNMSLLLIPLSKASVLFWTSPIIVALLGRVFLKEKLTIFDWVACFLAFLGILLIQNPFSAASSSTDDDYAKDLIGTCLALIGSLGAGIVGFSIKKLANMTHYLVPTATFAFFNILMGPPLTLFKLLFLNDTLTPLGWYEATMLVMIAVLLYLVLVFNTWAFKYEKAGRVAPI